MLARYLHHLRFIINMIGFVHDCVLEGHFVVFSCLGLKFLRLVLATEIVLTESIDARDCCCCCLRNGCFTLDGRFGRFRRDYVVFLTCSLHVYLRHFQIVFLLLARHICTFLPLSLWYLAHGEEVRGRWCLNLISINNFVQ